MPEPPERAHKLYTLILPVDPGDGTPNNPPKVILGMKKRGFGVGKANGYGGKFEPQDPSLHHSALRELHEESLLIPYPPNPEDPPPPPLLPIGILFLESIAPTRPPPDTSTKSLQASNDFPGPPTKIPTPAQILEIHITIAPLPTSYPPPYAPQETEEMAPRTYPITNIPVAIMWEESRLWLPSTLNHLFPPQSPSMPPTLSGEAAAPLNLPKPYYFTHYTRYTGGFSPNTGNWDVWEGLQIRPPATMISSSSSDVANPTYNTNHAIHIPSANPPDGWEEWGLAGNVDSGDVGKDAEVYRAQEEKRRRYALAWLEGRRKVEFERDDVDV